MQKFFLTVHSKITFEIRSDFELSFTTENILLLQAYVPGIAFIKENKKEATFLILLKQNKQKKLQLKKDELIISDEWLNGIPIYFYHLVYCISLKFWLQLGLYSLHSACLVKDNSCILLIGHSGSGKTTISLNLINKFGFQMFSSNKTLLRFTNKNLFEAISGTTTITQKVNILKTLQPNKISFVDRIAYRLNDNFYTKEKHFVIEQIYFARLNGNVKEYHSVNKSEALILLYQYLYDLFNSETILFNGKEIFESKRISRASKTTTLELLANAIKKIPIYEVSGSINFISKKINENHQHE